MVEFARNLAYFAAANGKKHVIVLSTLEFGRWQNIDMSRYQLGVYESSPDALALVQQRSPVVKNVSSALCKTSTIPAIELAAASVRNDKV
ncbi:hypothetical protein K7X08_008810 [Anisodus acutangulus]|uniref:Uncharacterized protein n=1 Tax=Anisodus acutangulus TaxID=402998 RepID=A0A9Q1RSW7_9SOLA|nr:hypothetical protein K7X08_008810 [Anisodus acutangulus]